MAGRLVISLDFELMWGLLDRGEAVQFGESVAGVHRMLPQLLELFARYDVQATFAVVGNLFFEDVHDWQSHLPDQLPDYDDPSLSPYEYYRKHRDLMAAHPEWFFAPRLIEQVRASSRHELATHTFSHYYCLEPGQNPETFRADLRQAIELGRRFDIEFRSIVFPRNQYSRSYLHVCRDVGLSAYRGNEGSWVYHPRAGHQESRFQRACRFADSYVNLAGHQIRGTLTRGANDIPGLVNIPSSRFLRPYRSSLSWLEQWRWRRIQRGMRYAAERDGIYHLWWHPHNFGCQSRDNLAFLERILSSFAELRRRLDFESRTMASVAEEISHVHDHTGSPGPRHQAA